MASIIKEGRLTCPGCQAQHPVDVVTQLPVNYELESLLKLQPVPEADYYHDKIDPISLSEVMCNIHNCDVYLRCTTHKVWICQQCTTGDHPLNKCKIISISEELEVRKESLLMFLNEEYERSVQSLLRVRQSLAQVEDENKKHEEVIGHLAEIILQHRDEQGHLEVQREALEHSIEDLKDKAWVLDQGVVSLQDALSVQEIVGSCQEAQANLAYVKDFADVSNIEQQSMDAILHSYKIRATTSMGIHAIHGTNSADNNDEPDKPTTSECNDADKKQSSHKQDNNDDTHMNQVDYTPTLERSTWQQIMSQHSSDTACVQEALESTAQRFCKIWDMPRPPSLEPPLLLRHESATAGSQTSNSNHLATSDGNQEPSQMEEETIASLYEKLWLIPKYTQPHTSPEPTNDITIRDRMHDTGWKSSMYSTDVPVREHSILSRFDEIWDLPRSSSIVSLNNIDQLENIPTQENSLQSPKYQENSSNQEIPEIPEYPSKYLGDNLSNHNCHDISSSIFMDIAERLSPTITLNETLQKESRDSNNISPSSLIPDKLPKNSQDIIKSPYSYKTKDSKSNDVDYLSNQVDKSLLNSEEVSTNSFEKLYKKSNLSNEVTPDEDDSFTSPFQKLWKKSNVHESTISSEEGSQLRPPAKLQKSPSMKQVTKYLKNKTSTKSNKGKEEKQSLDTKDLEQSSRISFSEEVDYSTGYQSGDRQQPETNLHTYHTNLPFIEEEQENYDSNSDAEPTHDNPWKLSKLTSCVPL